MKRNLEIKARIPGVSDLARKLAEIADSGPIEIIQDDTFFRCESGRLKLRQFSDHDGELIFYNREDGSGPKESFYLCSHTTDPKTVKESLAAAYGERGRVKKHRTLFLPGRTRIHLDIVEGPGEFLELEVVLQESETLSASMHEAECLMERNDLTSARHNW